MAGGASPNVSVYKLAMDDKPVIDAALPTDEVVEKFKEAFNLQARATLLKADAEAKQKLADELHAKAEYHAKKARIWTRIAYGSLAIGGTAQVVNLVSHYLRSHP